MPVSGAEDSQFPGAAMSTPPTDDGRSTNYANADAAASEGVPATSFRLQVPVDRDTTSSQQRRGGNLVLYVKSNDTESEAASRGTTRMAQLVPENGAGANSERGSLVEEYSENADQGQESLLSLLLSASTSAIESVRSMASGVTCKPLVTASLVLLYFILLDIVLLSGNERLNRVLRRMRAADNDALLLLSTNLLRQVTDAKREWKDALDGSSSDVVNRELEMAQQSVKGLERVYNRSVSRLHARLMFPGTVDDLFFLIEEHSTFDDRLRDLAAHEMNWVTTVMAGHAVQAGSSGVEASSPHTLDSADSATCASSSGSGDGCESLPADEERNADADLNPLRNVRLQRVDGDGTWARQESDSYSKLSYASVRGAAASRQQPGSTSAALSKQKGVRRVVRGVLSVLKNKCVAFLLMCALLSAVLRMG
ncbi:hypothetical protein JKF63_03284 [Porcisia hertigi]|uniref:Uncharacterized protein n=1 Tax=Porcisia hertigi TaxID=2761500 RepID=A0A836LAR0_9TRYP|nr:hypothetical protein JKF63_03284 [Porcisia hertigi]